MHSGNNNPEWFGSGIDSCDVDADREAFRHLNARSARLAEVDLPSLSPVQMADHVTEMVRVNEQLTRLIGTVVRVAERSQTHLANGEKSMTALIRARTHLHTTQAARYKTAADSLDLFPTFAQAFTEERVTLGHLEVMAGLLARANSHQVIGCEPQLCALAILCTTEEFRDKTKEWEAAADPSEHLDDYIRAQADEHLWYGKDLFGNLHYSGTYSPHNGEQFLQGVERRSNKLWHDDQKRNECPRRTPAQRRAAALLELVIDGSSTPAGSKRPEPLIEIITSQPPDSMPEPPVGTRTPEDPQFWNQDERVAAALRRSFGINPDPDGPKPPPTMPGPTNIFPQTVDGKLIPHQIVAELAKSGKLRTTIIKPDGNPVKDPALDGRDFTDRQKRQIRHRDRTCQQHGCTSPARYCEYDHVTPAARGGPTAVANGQLLCRFHHRWKHRSDPKPIQLE